MRIGHRTGKRAWLTVGAAVVVTAAAACDAVLGIPGDLRDRAANGGLRDGRFTTLGGGLVSGKTASGATLLLTDAALERRAPDGAAAGCAGGLCLRGTLAARGGGQ